jgi:uncharacterized cupredoxin-like copper-binding protein
MRRFVTILLATAAVVGTAVAGYAFAGGTTPSTAHATEVTVVNVTATEYNFQLSQTTGPAGDYSFVIHNSGTIEHDFAIGGKDSPTISPGGTATLNVTLTAGQKPYVCTIGEHASFGMEGFFNVTPGTTSTVVSTTPGGGTTVVTTTPPPPPPPTPSTTVKVTEKEFKILLPTVNKKVKYRAKVKGKFVTKTKIVKVQKPIKHGLVRFVVKNVGKIPHDFVIGTDRTLSIKPGASYTLDATLAKGKYKYVCSVTGHAALGMKGTLVVS